MIHMKNKAITLITALCVVVLFIFTPAYAQTSDSNEILDEVRYLIENYYVEEVSEDVLNAGDIEDIIQALGDPYSSYMTADEYQALMDSIEMEFVGIGVTVEKVPEGVLILSVFKGSGAEAAGLQPGDIIINANGVDLKDLDLSEALRYIKGDEGTAVLLTIKRGDVVFSVPVLRKRITLPTVEWELIDEVGYIRVWSFGEDTATQFEQAVKELEEEGAKGLIIDLRGNGGGYLQSGVDMAGYFTDGQPATLVHVRSEGTYYLVPEQDFQVDLPVLVLIDGFTASASELFAGALQDYSRAYLLGGNTFGKGSIQSLFPLSDGSVLRLTVGHFYTPRGRQISGTGLKPDLNLRDEFLLNAAVLLLGGDAENRNSKEGFTAVQIKEGDILDVDLSKARSDEYWESYRHIIESALNEGKELYIGTDDGWQKSGELQLYRWYYPYYDEVPVLKGIKPDKEFTVTFSKPVDAGEVKGKIQLIDAETGERTPCSVFQLSDNQVKVVPDELLQSGREYYLVIEEGIRARTGAYLGQGVLCRAVVEE
ncbi:carboxyl-terminal processing protease [Caldicoprobacter guelmensis]|nr:carboxyl-terminal processing protease [Caldicoprobacter guelmensis]